MILNYVVLSSCTLFIQKLGVTECKMPFIVLLIVLSKRNTVFRVVIVVFLLSFSGYRLFKGTMFTTGFIFGSSIVYFVCFTFDVLPFGGRIGLSVGAGLLCGLTAIFIYYVGLFVVGFNFGFLLAVAGLVIVEQLYHPFTEWIPIGVILSVAVVCALLVSIMIGLLRFS